MIQKAIFAAGCFWCYEPVFSSLKGVSDVRSGYSGGVKNLPTYEEVSTGSTGHAESVIVEFDSDVISYETLLDVFWEIHDPTSLNRQGNDEGEQYRSAIFYTDEDQKVQAEKSRDEHQKKFDKPIVTQIEKFNEFYDAEEYHQKFFERNPNYGYCSVVIAPKIKKFREKFAQLLK